MKASWLAALGFWSTLAAAVEPVTLVDANGVVMGPVISYDHSDPKIVFPLNAGGGRVLIRVFPQQYDETDSVYYQTNDCTGTPLIPYSTGDIEFSTPYAIGAPGKTLYVAVLSKPVVSRTASSRGAVGACSTTSLTRQFAIARATSDLATIFTPPFRVRFSSSVPTLP
jgi:hypothetical protein